MILTEEQLTEDLFTAYYSARKHKRNTHSQLQYELNYEGNLIALCHRIFSRTYQPGASICFVVKNTVTREVFAASFEDRVVHHLIFNYLNPIFERTFITDSYSCRKGKGTLYGIKRLEKAVRECSDNYKRASYIMTLDIKSYFMSINRKILLSKIEDTLSKYRYRRDPDTALMYEEILDFDLCSYLIKIVVNSDCTKNFIYKSSPAERKDLVPSKSLFNSKPNCGLPIGNLTSQLFSNIYLNAFDHYMKRVLKLRYYGRYVDYFYVIGRSLKQLKEVKLLAERFLSCNVQLELHPNKMRLQHHSKGVRYIGAVVYPYNLQADRRVKRAYQLVLAEAAGAESFAEFHGCVERAKSYWGVYAAL